MNTDQSILSRQWLRAAMWAAALTCLAVAVSSPGVLRRLGFCAPAAHLAALATGAPCAADPEGYRLAGPDLDLVVVPACAATDFFCLLTGFLSVLLSWRGCPPAGQLAVLPLAWLITIVTNAVRLASCWQVDTWARAALPTSLWPGLHLATGVSTFLLAMTAVFWGMTMCRTKPMQTHHGRTT